MAELTSWMEGPRWARISDFLLKSALNLGLSLTITRENKGLIRTTVYFTVSGDADRLQRFANELRAAVREY